MITTAKGDIADIIENTRKQYQGKNKRLVVIHGCNCFNNMGKGIALRLAQLYPQIVDSDNKTRKGDKSKLGDYTSAAIALDLVICNAYSQYTYGRGIQVDYNALESALTKIVQDANQYSHMPVVFLVPEKIGAGLAGGDPSIVREILNRVFENTDAILFDL